MSVNADATFKEIARTLADQGVSAVPVLDAMGRPAGVVSEADLLRKAASRSDLSGRMDALHIPEFERTKVEGVTAGDVMSAPAICAHRGAS